MPVIRRYRLVGAGLLFVSALTCATWGLVGEAMEAYGGEDPYLYIARAPQWLDELGSSFGIMCSVVAAGTLGWLLAEYRQRRWRSEWWSICVLVSLLGIGTASGGRVVTAASDGANFGGGIILVFVAPVALIFFFVLLFATWAKLLSPPGVGAKTQVGVSKVW